MYTCNNSYDVNNKGYNVSDKLSYAPTSSSQQDDNLLLQFHESQPVSEVSNENQVSHSIKNLRRYAETSNNGGSNPPVPDHNVIGTNIQGNVGNMYVNNEYCTDRRVPSTSDDCINDFFFGNKNLSLFRQGDDDFNSDCVKTHLFPDTVEDKEKFYPFPDVGIGARSQESVESFKLMLSKGEGENLSLFQNKGAIFPMNYDIREDSVENKYVANSTMNKKFIPISQTYGESSRQPLVEIGNIKNPVFHRKGEQNITEATNVQNIYLNEEQRRIGPTNENMQFNICNTSVAPYPSFSYKTSGENISECYDGVHESNASMHNMHNASFHNIHDGNPINYHNCPLKEVTGVNTGCMKELTNQQGYRRSFWGKESSKEIPRYGVVSFISFFDYKNLWLKMYVEKRNISMGIICLHLSEISIFDGVILKHSYAS